MKSINWKLVGLFFLKLFLYVVVIPVSASFFQLVAFTVALPIIYDVKFIAGPTAIGLRIWSMMAIVIYTLFFYVYVGLHRFVKTKSLRRWMLFLFIFIPGFLGGAQFTMATYWAILGNLLYSSYFYIVYYIAEYFLPSFRGQLKTEPDES
jgi:hypothetical protein